MMCADFVCSAYQCRVEDPKIKVEAQRMVPMKLEDCLNKHPEDWMLVGKISKKDATSFNSEYVSYPKLA